MKLIDIHKTTRHTFELSRGYQPYSSLFYILEGCFKIKFNDEWKIVKKGDIIYLPKTLYFEREIIEPINFYYLRFEDDNAYYPYGGILKTDNISYFKSTINSILKAYDKTSMQHICDILLESILCSNILFSDENCNDVNIAECMNYITEHFCDDISLDYLCGITGYSKTVLIEKFKQNYKVTPAIYINKLRMDKAKNYLVNTNISIAEIAFSCGFHCQYYFSNAFKKHFGESPLQYRKNARI